ncbi:MAG TPA: hypothetical protein VJ692_09355 [Nitrospiraceae bacterium]|nr:hypothetical protein [Nitrospiraceae bacterium]
MAKKTPIDTDLARLKEKVKMKTAGVESPESDPALRSLHKRLKRTQRKRRSEAMRKRRAMGKAAGSAEASKA